MGNTFPILAFSQKKSYGGCVLQSVNCIAFLTLKFDPRNDNFFLYELERVMLVFFLHVRAEMGPWENHVMKIPHEGHEPTFYGLPPGLCRHITGSFRILNNGQYRVLTVFACLAVTKTVLGHRTRKTQRKKKLRKRKSGIHS